jgi:hypothetical protein
MYRVKNPPGIGNAGSSPAGKQVHEISGTPREKSSKT